jgi:hypothetical protein
MCAARPVTRRSPAPCATPEGGVAGTEGRAEPFVAKAEPIEADITSVMEAEKALIKLDKLEGVVSLSQSKEEEVVIFEDDIDAEMEVTSTLRSHYDFWVESGASEFAKSVVRNGYIPSFSEIPSGYKKPNNKSYKENRFWANESVAKLEKAGIAVEVHEWSLVCISPLSVAINAKGKLRLCNDLSRCFNVCCKAMKFKIESTAEVLKIIQQGDWMASFDLKSA